MCGPIFGIQINAFIILTSYLTTFCARAWLRLPTTRSFRHTSRILPSGKLMASCSSLAGFLAAKPSEYNHIVIGNPAGDADSIISAVGLAYVDHLVDNGAMVPIVSVRREELALRPETLLLLKILEIPCDSLICLDDLTLETKPSAITLVDHNKLAFTQLEGCPVVEILDHHLDEGSHKNVTGGLRNIAFEGDKALVASTCTLVAERLIESRRPIPADLSFALLSVVLLDSVNMSDTAGKVTPRDRTALNALVRAPDWSALSQRQSARDFFLENKPDLSRIFDALSQSKFDAKFWKSLSVKDALRLDYKQFTTSNGRLFGASSILLALEHFLEKPKLEAEILEYMSSCQIPVLIVLTMVVVDDTARRSILVCGPPDSSHLVNSLADHLVSSESLLMQEQTTVDCFPKLCCRKFAQGNPKASRKQVVPIIMDFYESS